MKNFCSWLYEGRAGRGTLRTGSMTREVSERSLVDTTGTSKAFVALATQDSLLLSRDKTDMLTSAACTVLPVDSFPFQFLETAILKEVLDSRKCARSVLQKRVSLVRVSLSFNDGRKTDVYDSCCNRG
jgi:hypothetical protein